MSELGLASTRHCVISRFSVNTDDERIIVWNALDRSAPFRS
jgi:hypothetical protein